VTDYGLDGPGSNSGGDEIFRPSRPAFGPTQPPGYRVFLGDKVRPGRVADHSTPFSAVVHGRVELYLYPPSGPHRACNGIILPLFFTLRKLYECHVIFVLRSRSHSFLCAFAKLRKTTISYVIRNANNLQRKE